MDTENSAFIKSILPDLRDAVPNDDCVDVGFVLVPWCRTAGGVIGDRSVAGDGQFPSVGQYPVQAPCLSFVPGQFFVPGVVLLIAFGIAGDDMVCLLYTSPSPRD